MRIHEVRTTNLVPIPFSDIPHFFHYFLQVPVSVMSMNKGDCFILTTPTGIWVYIGRYSKRVERVKAVQAADQIRDQDHSENTRIQVVDAKSSPEIVSTYFLALGGGDRSLVADPPEEDDDDKENTVAPNTTPVSLYQVSDASGGIRVSRTGTGSLSSDMLSSSDCYILHAPSESEIYVWVGSGCTPQEKVEAFGTAEKFLADDTVPTSSSCQVQCVSDGREPSSFRKFFATWKSQGSTSAPAVTSKVSQSPYIIGSLANAIKSAKLLKNLGTAPSFCPDDGSGLVELWRIENFQLAPVPPETYGLFYGGDSYVARYTCAGENEDQVIIYYWQGSQSTTDEVGASALHAVKLDEELKLRATLIRVQQGFEPAHFLRIFKGRIITFLGGHASGFRNLRGRSDTYDETLGKLFHVRSTCPGDCRAVQVELSVTSLDSDDVFVLIAPGRGELLDSNCVILS